MACKTELDDRNVALYAAQNYINKRILSVDEFHEDFLYFKYLKKLLTRYKNKGTLQERLILNHLIHLYNVFDFDACTHICQYKISEECWPALKTFLLYLNYITEDNLVFINTPIDLYVTRKLQQI